MGIFEIDNFITQQECENFINHIKDVMTKKTSLGDCYQTFDTNPTIAKFLNARLLEKTKNNPEIIQYSKTKFINIDKKITLTHYNSGQFKRLHRDSKFTNVKKTEITKMTLLIYLNDDFKNGRTIFYPEFTTEIKHVDGWFDIKPFEDRINEDTKTIIKNPKKYKAVIFDTDIIHYGEAPIGEKWLISCKLQFTK